MKLAPYIACICEGSAEAAIIDVLVDNNLLIFTREDMLEENVIRCRSAKTFEERFLRKGFKDQISVIRILDSRREEFRLSKAYEKKVDVINPYSKSDDDEKDRYEAFEKDNGVVKVIISRTRERDIHYMV